MIEKVEAWEILDSRGNPTLAVRVNLRGGISATAQVPSGASTGTHEAHELRDGDANRYCGKGVLQAAANVNGEINAALAGQPDELAVVDRLLINLDGTPNKSRLGANAILGVSCALARAISIQQKQPLYRTLTGTAAPRLPVPMINIFSGGLHAGGQIEFQDFLIIPHGFYSYAEALEAAVAVHHAARKLVTESGYLLTGVADEGGWGPRLESNERALELLTRSIERAGFEGQISIALDVASSHFYHDGLYTLHSEGRSLSAGEMVALLENWCASYPIVSIEDALAEDDWTGWRYLTDRLGAKINLVGDDFFTTKPERVRRGLAEGTANAVLVKMNQIGTLTETFEVLDLAREGGWAAVVSARSGETEDSFLADLATASGAGQIKIGSITRSERLAKYNRLLEIERESGLPYTGRQFKVGLAPAQL